MKLDASSIEEQDARLHPQYGEFSSSIVTLEICQQSLFATKITLFDWWTRYRSIAAINTTVPLLGSKDGSATFAVIKILASIGWHFSVSEWPHFELKYTNYGCAVSEELKAMAASEFCVWLLRSGYWGIADRNRFPFWLLFYRSYFTAFVSTLLLQLSRTSLQASGVFR